MTKLVSFVVPLTSIFGALMLMFRCFDVGRKEDAMTKRLRGLADHWVDISAKTALEVPSQSSSHEPSQ